MTTNRIKDLVLLMNELKTKVGVLRMFVRGHRGPYGIGYNCSDDRLELMENQLEVLFRDMPDDINAELNNLREIYDDILQNGILIDIETTLKTPEEMQEFESIII